MEGEEGDKGGDEEDKNEADEADEAEDETDDEEERSGTTTVRQGFRGCRRQEGFSLECKLTAVSEGPRRRAF